MNPKKLKIIIAGMAICIALVSFKFYEVNNDLKKYKEYYKDLSIMYLKEVIEAPKLLAPSSEEMKVTTIDFESNMLQFSDLENNISTIQNFKGKNLFVNYWATWCNPCLAEMPYMVELYEKYKNEEDIKFLFLSREDLKTIKNYIPKDENLQKLPIYKIITDDEFFATSGIPTTFIIDSTGEVIVKDVGTAFWNDESVFKFIDSLIGNNEI
jgi:thiol-disulfide isomerase/thioredoxin|tara:strand:- start:306 stop:938 length:633 start_codon:yes stop_codon:yes gene_type:complete